MNDPTWTGALRLLAATTAAVCLAACGGGGGGGGGGTSGGAGGDGSGTVQPGPDGGSPGTGPGVPTEPTVPAVPPPPPLAFPVQAEPDPLLDGLANIPVDAPTQGMWSSTQPWPSNALHAALLPTGKVLTYGSPPDNPAGQDGRLYDLWSPALGFGEGSHRTATAFGPVNSFCSTAAYLGDGKLLISGGNTPLASGLFSPVSNTVALDPSSLADQRWYATMLTLTDGRAVILGGMDPYQEGMVNAPDAAIAAGTVSMTPEIYTAGSGWRTLFGARSRDAFGPDYLRASYPRAWVAPDGKVVGISAETMWKLDPAASDAQGAVTVLGKFKTPPSATAPVNVGATNSAVMFAPGKVLQMGGNGTNNGDGLPASAMATVVDFNSATPQLTETAPMRFARRYGNATVLPDGKVVVTGGTRRGNNGGADAVYEAEVWDPATGRWTTGARAANIRVYHSAALLLPNGTVLSSGGGAPGPVDNQNVEIYYPPNLFQTVDGAARLAPRPVLTGISALGLAPGARFQLDLADASRVTRLALVTNGTVTHSFNSTQRFQELSFTKDGNRLTAQLPANTNLTPPGYYQLFALDANGVPSRAVIVGIGQGIAAPPITLPSAATACADEGGLCRVPAGRRGVVYYGVDGKFAIRSDQTGDVACTAANFGSDPTPGAAKRCYLLLVDPASAVPAIDAAPLRTGGTASYAPVVGLAGASYRWDFGDGSAPTAYAATSAASHTYTAPGVYTVTLTVRDANGQVGTRTFVQAVTAAPTANAPVASTPLLLETRSAAATRLWVVNPDNDSVTVFDTVANSRVREIPVGVAPRTLARAADGNVWVANRDSASISVIDPASLTVVRTIALPRASQPWGLVGASDGRMYVSLEAAGRLLKLDGSGATLATLDVGANPRHLAVSGDASRVLVSRFITPPLAGEATAVVDTASGGGEVLAVNTATMALAGTVRLRHSDRNDNEVQGSGIPNYLGPAVIAPDGARAWVPSKQDNIGRGVLRNGRNLDFQNTVRAISSRIDLATLAEDAPARVDHDNASLASAAAYDPSGAYLFVALETSRQVEVVDAIAGRRLFRIEAGLAPQGVTVSADGSKLYVHNFMARSVSVVDVSPLTRLGELRSALVATLASVATEKLAANVLKGKQLFYDARDTRLARDAYMSCATCHNDGAQDGRVWDMTGFGEGLRNTIALKGRGGMGQGFLHWSANFDEVQDFEGQIRNLAGGTGLMSDALFNAGTRSQPLGDAKAGLSADLDAMAAYLASLNTFAPSPLRNPDGGLTAAALAGKSVFQAQNCASCHSGVPFTASADATQLKNVGTLKPSSGKRLGGVLPGTDVPTLRDVWATGPFLHDGSAPTLADAVRAHNGTTLDAGNLGNLTEYLRQIGAEE